MRTKICGAGTDRDVELLADLGVELIGLWHGVPGGRADLALADLVRLAGLAARRGAAPVLVTFLRERAALRSALAASGTHWVQLHGYQPPALVAGLKADGASVIKVLHLRAGECAEKPLISAYERAGVDMFLLDSVAEDGRVGSTGRQTPADAVAALAAGLSRQFLLAGGIDAAAAERYARVVADPRFAGIDVDGGARGADGAFDAARIKVLRQAWTAP